MITSVCLTKYMSSAGYHGVERTLIEEDPVGLNHCNEYLTFV